jgi:hypothetical protein
MLFVTVVTIFQPEYIIYIKILNKALLLRLRGFLFLLLNYKLPTTIY